MDWWVWVVIALVAGPLIGGIFHTQQTANAFQSLGDISGRPITEIIAIVGQPNSMSGGADGKTVYQWLQVVGGSSSHYAIVVDRDGKAEGYSHQAIF